MSTDQGILSPKMVNNVVQNCPPTRILQPYRMRMALETNTFIMSYNYYLIFYLKLGFGK